MTKRYFRKLVILAKIEVTYGTDPTPTGAANAMQINDVTITPLAGSDETRDLLLPYLGNQGKILVGNYVQLQFNVEIAGSGAAGTPPAYGPLLRACGMAETIVDDTSVAYEPVSSDYESVTAWANLDGVRHILLGARGTVNLTLTPLKIPRWTFQLWGLLGTITDTALPTPTLTGFVLPVPVNKTNTTLSLHGASQIAESVSLDLGNKCEPRLLIGSESIEITDRQSTGTVVVEATTIATKDWFGIAKARTRGALAAVHGIVAGNIVTIGAPAVEIGRPTYGNTQGIANYSLPLDLCPSSGDDEFAITFT